LIHCISLESENVADVYKMIRRELGAHNKTLLGKEEIIVLTKTDLVDAETIKRAEKSLKEYKRKIFKISILDDKSIKIFSDGLAKILRAA
jgi:GTPase involved in cell partitioning and DNA repair